MVKTRLLSAILFGCGIGLFSMPGWSQDPPTSGGIAGAKEGSSSSSGDGIKAPELSAGEMLEAERRLAALGFRPGAVDGVIDSHAQQAIREFQKQSHLAVTGTLDRETTERLGIPSGGSPPLQRKSGDEKHQ